MTVGKAVWIRCDGCGDATADLGDYRTVREAREVALAIGWVTRKGRDFCDDCVNEGRV